MEFKGIKETADWDSGSEPENQTPGSKQDRESIVSMDSGAKDLKIPDPNSIRLDDLEPKVRGLEDLGPRFPGSTNLELDCESSSGSSTPINSPTRNLKARQN